MANPCNGLGDGYIDPPVSTTGVILVRNVVSRLTMAFAAFALVLTVPVGLAADKPTTAKRVEPPRLSPPQKITAVEGIKIGRAHV